MSDPLAQRLVDSDEMTTCLAEIAVLAARAPTLRIVVPECMAVTRRRDDGAFVQYPSPELLALRDRLAIAAR